MRIDSRLRPAVRFRCRRRPTTNFTRPRTKSSNPVLSSGESANEPVLATVDRPTVAARSIGQQTATLVCGDRPGPGTILLWIHQKSHHGPFPRVGANFIE